MLLAQSPGSVKAGSGEDATKAIRQVLEQQVAAWNKGDLEAFLAGYWNSPQLTFSSGKQMLHGWQATLDRYKKRYQSEGHEMGKLSFSNLQVEVLSPESAFVRGQWELVTSKETLGGLFTLIFKKMPDGWRIIHDHTSG
jgi:beta-aspartyl-peptidase (threonine type)